MRVTAGEFVKEIPARYERAVELLTLADWEKPEKVRLTEMERFKFAEAAWRMEQNTFVQELLLGHKPENVVFETNRSGETRAVVGYSEVGNKRHYAIVPRWVWVVCPKELTSSEFKNWVDA